MPLPEITTLQEMPITFNLVDKNATGVWKFYISTRNNGFELRKEISVMPNNTSFTLAPESINWEYVYYYRYDEYILYLCKIEFNEATGASDEIYFKLRLTPTRPIITDIEFNYIFDWETDDIYPNGEIAFTIESEDATMIRLLSSDFYNHSLPEPMIFQWSVDYDYDKETNNVITTTLVDWGTYFLPVARNDFGEIYCNDTIFTTDLITDPEILARINSYKDPASTKMNHMEQVHYVDRNHIYIPKAFKPLVIVDITGRRHHLECINNIIDISLLPKGIYIISYTNRQKQTSNFKIIKS